MVRGLLLSVVLFCFTVLQAAPAVSLTGKVVDTSNEAVVKARVALKKYPSIYAFTDDNGAFALPGSNAVLDKGIASGRAKAFIKNNRVLFSLASDREKVRIDVFSANGARLSSIRPELSGAGSHSVPLPDCARGIRIVKLTVGNESMVAKMVSGTIAEFGRDMSLVSPLRQTSAHAAAAIVDTLVVTSKGDMFTPQGFRHKLQGITAYSQQNIVIKLTPSNPWRPTDYSHTEKNMKKIYAKGFDFEMGQPDPDIWDKTFSSGEQPVHTVQFTHDFWIDSTEVTQKDYATLMTATYSTYTAPAWIAKFGLGDEYPAYLATWSDAVLYCNARSKRDGLDTVYRYTSISNKPGEVTCDLTDAGADTSKNGYRLPTEAEWEYVCRGGVGQDYFWARNMGPYPATGPDSSEISTFAIWGANAEGKGEGNAGYGTHAVATKVPNNYGIFDMIGNVSEMCHDAWTDYSYVAAVDPVGPLSSTDYVTRGGNWGNDATYLRSANRYFYSPNYPYYFRGFRVMKPIK